MKCSTHITSKSLKGLRTFGEDYPEAKAHMLYLGNLREYHGAIKVIPFVEALKELPQILE